jgi:hypothetical protein
MVESLWMQYRETGCQEALNRLTLHFAPIVKFACGRRGDSSPPAIQAGLESLRESIGSFDEPRQFERHLLTSDMPDVPVW